jgi:Protein of unknown function (DUF4238)
MKRNEQTRSKKQHYVMQGLLRNFAIQRKPTKRGQKAEYSIFCFDKTTSNVFRTNVTDIAHQNYFYDYTHTHGRSVSIERRLAKIDDKLFTPLKNVCADPSTAVLVANKTLVSYFISLQLLRTPYYRFALTDMARALNEQAINAPAIPSDEDVRRAQAYSMAHLTSRYATLLGKMQWTLVTNQTAKPFWTSDTPVVRHNPDESENLGLASPHMELQFPLSPKLILRITHPTASQQGTLGTVTNDNVDHVNSIRTAESYRYLYSVDDDFEIAKIMIQRYPEIANSNRPRFGLQGRNP